MEAEAQAATNRPPPFPQLRTQAEQMAFLVSTVQGMEKNIQEIMQNQKSLERVVKKRFHNMDVKVTELTTIIRHIQHEVDSVEIPRSEDEDEHDDDDDDNGDESPPPTTTRFSTKPRFMREDIIAYPNTQAAAEQEPREWDSLVSPPKNFDMRPDGYYGW
ncbi:hypothetical protein D1007_59766 [Hordeum vulgare]|nr:hypothetical protein D1007_59766 [Hordeum vulgare]